MNELQLALLGLGAVLVLLVWLINLWQTRRHRRQAESLLPKTEASDVLMAGREAVRQEPSIGQAAVPREPTFVTVPGSFDDSPVTGAAEIPRHAAPLPTEWADGRVDCLLRLEFVDAVPATELWAAQMIWSGAIDKPLQWLGLDERSERWRILTAQDQGNVSQLAAALQLADRRGPLPESALGTFLSGMHDMAKRFSGLIELPEQAAVLARARELDAFCAGLDLQLALYVLPRVGSLNEIQGAKLKPLIDVAGLRAEGEHFAAVDVDSTEVFMLTCQAATAFPVEHLESMSLKGLTFSLDVPRVADGLNAFDRMLGFAQRCAESLGGQLVDAHKNPLSDSTVKAIRTRIGELQAQMTQAGFPPGSIRALRLFS